MEQYTDPNLYLNPYYTAVQALREARHRALATGASVFLHHQNGSVKIVTLQQHVQVHNGQLITQADVVKW